MDKAVESYIHLTEVLARSRKVSTFDSAEEKEAATLAHALLDIKSSFQKIYVDLLPKLNVETVSEEQIDDVLFHIGEEFRHVLYHLSDTKYYAHLKSYFDTDSIDRRSRQ